MLHLPRIIFTGMNKGRTNFFFSWLKKAGADVMIYGHTHIPYFKQLNGKYFINAGSVGKPKDGDPRTCVCIIDILRDTVKVEFIRKEYDIKKSC